MPNEHQRDPLSFYDGWWFLLYRDNIRVCLATVLVEEYILEVAHWYGF